MTNHIKILCLLIISSLILAQPNTTVDSSKIDNPMEIPPTVKPVVEEIVSNSKESQAASLQINKEMNKQITLMKQIKMRINEIKKYSSNRKVDKITLVSNKKPPIDTSGVKNKDVILEVEGQAVQWETKDRSWFGRLFHSTDVLFYPYILDKDGNKIYLK